MGGYSGGMKRRLDLALALVHGPRILFLDEPTTGLDVQSRSALWDEVERLATQSGVTVFLTTQYLEEADVLADRVGIIDHGRIVAEGTPEALKAEIGRPTVEVVPADPGELERTRQVLTRFGERRGLPRPKGAAVRLTGGEAQLADVVRALDAEDIDMEHLQLHAPTLDDVFLAKTGRSLEGAGGGRGGGRAGGARRGVSAPRSPCRSGMLARRSVVRTLRQPPMVVPSLFFPLLLLAVNSGGLDVGHRAARLPDRLLPPVRARDPVHPGRALRRQQRRARTSPATSRRASSTASRSRRCAGVALMIGQLAGVLALGLIQAVDVS